MQEYSGRTVARHEDGSWTRMVDGESVEETGDGPDILCLARNYSHIYEMFSADVSCLVM